MTSQKQLLERVLAVEQLGEVTLASAGRSNHGNCDPNQRSKFRALGLALLKDLYGVTDHHYIDFDQRVNGSQAGDYEKGLGIIQAVKYQVENNWLAKTSSLIAAEVFTDFLEMAEHLLDENYKDAAAVIAGSSLEAHLRRLCLKWPIIQPNDSKGEPKKAAILNAELLKAGAYLLNEHKQIIAWQGIRNDAAHGNYNKVNEESVRLMIQGIRHFITIHPA